MMAAQINALYHNVGILSFSRDRLAMMETKSVTMPAIMSASLQDAAMVFFRRLMTSNAMMGIKSMKTSVPTFASFPFVAMESQTVAQKSNVMMEMKKIMITAQIDVLPQIAVMGWSSRTRNAMMVTT